jgi:hypothetical protein
VAYSTSAAWMLTVIKAGSLWLAMSQSSHISER